MKKYEYEIRNKATNKCLDRAFVREDARTLKNEWKSAGFDVKIVQQTFEMVEQKEVR